jgi:16S rRNA (adenine1518-N6/adenine1519-N6)-dimethyltransferase
MTNDPSCSHPSLPLPLKRLGQHFLADPNIARKIVSLAGLTSDETVLEIGPGRGVLTGLLSVVARRVIAVEVDIRLEPYLNNLFRDRRNIDLMFEDALTFSYETLPAGTVVVANLPYYISSPLLFRFFEARQRLSRLVLMLQKEVAARLTASPGSRDYGILSVLASYHGEVRNVFTVSRNCFRPRPDVESAVVQMTFSNHGAVAVQSEGILVRTVRAAFAHRRKTLANSLRDAGLNPSVIAAAMSEAAIPPGRRAETLGLEEFGALANALARVGGFEGGRSES